MGIVKLDLVPRYSRPVVAKKTDLGNISIIFDTGAIKSVWNGDSDTLKLHFPDARKTKYKTRVSGFGGISTVYRDIWEIPKFEFNDRDNPTIKYTLINFLVAIVDDLDLGFDLVFGATAFKKTSYSVLNVGKHKGTFAIYTSGRDYGCTVDGAMDKGDFFYVTGFTSFLQDDDTDNINDEDIETLLNAQTTNGKTTHYRYKITTNRNEVFEVCADNPQVAITKILQKYINMRLFLQNLAKKQMQKSNS